TPRRAARPAVPQPLRHRHEPRRPGKAAGHTRRDRRSRRTHPGRAKCLTALVAPPLPEKKVSPHVRRHTAAMRLLAAGVDSTVIALWLGHESVATTQVYIHADLAIKEKAL